VTGTISFSTRATADWKQNLDHRTDDDGNGVHVELGVDRVGLGHADHQPRDDREVPEHRSQRRNGEMLVGVENSDDDSRNSEQRDDREQHARQPDCERAVPAGISERPQHERRQHDEERREGAEAQEHQPEEARRDAPGAPAFAFLEQLAEDRNERR
jgi:hypothetical protein